MDELPDKKSVGDAAREVGRAIVSAIPVAGGPLQVLFETVFSAPLEKRKQEWLERLADVVNELERRIDGFTPAKLAENQTFITVALQATQVALRNHQEEKLSALRNAVLNSALPNPPEEDQQLIFLRLVDQLTSWHLRVLALFDNPTRWMERHGVVNPGWGVGGVSTVLQHCFPELRGKREFYDQITRDLQTDGLAMQGQFLHLTMTGNGMVESRTNKVRS